MVSQLDQVAPPFVHAIRGGVPLSSVVGGGEMLYWSNMHCIKEGGEGVEEGVAGSFLAGRRRGRGSERAFADFASVLFPLLLPDLFCVHPLHLSPPPTSFALPSLA